jgi:hypothetical protein
VAQVGSQPSSKNPELSKFLRKDFIGNLFLKNKKTIAKITNIMNNTNTRSEILGSGNNSKSVTPKSVIKLKNQGKFGPSKSPSKHIQFMVENPGRIGLNDGTKSSIMTTGQQTENSVNTNLTLNDSDKKFLAEKPKFKSHSHLGDFADSGLVMKHGRGVTGASKEINRKSAEAQEIRLGDLGQSSLANSEVRTSPANPEIHFLEIQTLEIHKNTITAIQIVENYVITAS